MSGSPVIWFAAGGISVALNAGLAGLLGLSIDPETVEPQPRPESRIELTAYPVKRDDAPAKDASGQTATEVQNSGSALAGGEIPSSRTSGVTLSKTMATPSSPTAPLIKNTLESVPVANDVTASAPASQKLAASGLSATPLSTVSPKAAGIKPGRLPDALAIAVSSDAPKLLGASLDVGTTAPVAQSGEQVDSLRPMGEAAKDVAPTVDMASAAPIPSERQTAALAWSGEGQETVDPASLAAIQSFMTEGDLSQSDQNIGAVRDGIDGLLAQVPCSRLQVEFSPETGRLELRGHVPEEGLRTPIREALQARIGSSIPVADNLLILPRPQCGALAGIANAGLPQSTDQRTNPRLIGPDTHTRLYGFVEGERLTFDLVAPDYDAHIYVDYFDAAGNVIHLVPNERVTLEKFPAKSEFRIGADRADGNFLAVNIGPPFGQEIAAAFAASVPLYDGVRPLVEPAGPYLEWLQTQITRARASNPDFKGEWVYFFVRTSAQ